MKKSDVDVYKKTKKFLEDNIDMDERYYVVSIGNFPKIALGKFMPPHISGCVFHEKGAYWLLDDFKDNLFKEAGGCYGRKIFKFSEKEKIKDYLKLGYAKLIKKSERDVINYTKYLKSRIDFLAKLNSKLCSLKG